jgi:hypothetical protein
MRNPTRGIPKPAAASAGDRIQSIKVAKDTVWLPGTKGVFNTTCNEPELLYNTTPMMERLNTPRQVTRAITLERNFTNKRWLYNKSTCDGFNPDQSKKEMDRNKLLKRITRKEDKKKGGYNMSRADASKHSESAHGSSMPSLHLK